jgi:hypothetical protein
MGQKAFDAGHNVGNSPFFIKDAFLGAGLAVTMQLDECHRLWIDSFCE